MRALSAVPLQRLKDASTDMTMILPPPMTRPMPMTTTTTATLTDIFKTPSCRPSLSPNP